MSGSSHHIADRSKLVPFFVGLALLAGCAWSSVQRADGATLRARVLGAGIAEAGDCAVQVVDLANPTADSKATAENRTLVASGPTCALAEGGRGSTGLYATIAAGFAALVTLLAAGL